MKLFKTTAIGAAAVAALTFGNAVQAGTIVDLFVDPPGGQVVDTNPGTPSGNYNQNVTSYPATIVGGYRDLGITQNSSVLPNTYASASVAGGFLVLSNDSTVVSTTVVTWDGNNLAGVGGASVNTVGLAGANLAAGGANAIESFVYFADLGFNYKITVWDMDGDFSTLSATAQFPIDSFDPLSPNYRPADQATYLFDWFNLASGNYCDGLATPPNPTCSTSQTQLQFNILRGSDGSSDGVIDFSQIGALQLWLNNTGVTSADFVLGRVDSVPEPGALALSGLALFGAAIARRRAKARVGKALG